MPHALSFLDAVCLFFCGLEIHHGAIEVKLLDFVITLQPFAQLPGRFKRRCSRCFVRWFLRYLAVSERGEDGGERLHVCDFSSVSRHWGQKTAGYSILT